MNTETTTVEQEQHLFTEQELTMQSEGIILEREATSWQRFFNFLIDWAVCNYGIGLITGIVIAALVIAIDPELAYDLFVEKTTMLGILGLYLITIINFILYYTLSEKLFKGVTLGKLITGTRAIRQDGYHLTWKDAFMRSLCRLVPFEPFSALGNWPWHDRWTNTMVIKTR